MRAARGFLKKARGPYPLPPAGAIPYNAPGLALRRMNSSDGHHAMHDTTPAGTLYLVPTPLGHDDDITRRALDVLGRVDLIAAEDTRSAARLLARHGLGQPLLSYHDHNEQQRLETLLERLRGGEDVAVVSEAGTPLISDPGFRIVQAAIEAQIPVVSLPGPSAPITALVASGLPVHSFCFLGFPPRKARQRKAFWGERVADTATLIVFEAPHRALESLEDALEVLGDRPMALARNLTKEYEEILRGTISEVCAALRGRDKVLGELTVVIAGSDGGEDPRVWERAEEAIGQMLAQGVEPRLIRDVVATLTDLPRRAIYQRILEARSSS